MTRIHVSANGHTINASPFAYSGPSASVARPCSASDFVLHLRGVLLPQPSSGCGPGSGARTADRDTGTPCMEATTQKKYFKDIEKL